MRILFSAFIILLLSPNAKAQVEWTVFAGPQMTSARYEVSAYSITNKQPNSYKYGFIAGVGLKVPFEAPIYFYPSIFYSMKGYKVQLNQSLYPPDQFAIDNDTRIHTFETAFLIRVNLSQQPGHIFVSTGPSLDFQLFGREKFHSTQQGYVDRNMKYGYEHYGHFAANWVLELGYETANGFFVNGRYAYGLTNLVNTDEGPKISHLAAGITFGKVLGRKP
jgi:hypothetical protein